MKKTVLITGVAGGIGTATAKLFSEKQWRVVGVDKKKIQGAFIDRFIKGDISDKDNIFNIIKEYTETEERMDALVNNAALQICGSLEKINIEQWDKLMNINARAPYFLTQCAAPLLGKSEGSVVNIGSVHAVATSKLMSLYAASKGAVLAMTRAIAVELAPMGVRVNTVLPGAVDTPMLREGLMKDSEGIELIEQKMMQLKKRHLQGRIGKPEEIAQMIYFLADEEKASFITGQAICVDGGATARLSTE